MFQPNPTTVTVVPPARTIQVIGEPEDVVADEELGRVESSSRIPQVLPMAQQELGQMPMAPAMAPQQGGYMMPQQGGYMMPQQGYHNLNMSPYPTVYAASMPQPAQLYTSGVPGSPPTIAVSTDQMQMGGFMMQNAPRPMRSNITLKRKAVSFGGSNDQEASGSSTDPAVKITVIKGT
jgi:hypothetical protein